MTKPLIKILLAVSLLVSSEAYALRCGNKLVKIDMYQTEIDAMCGKPVSTQYLGYVIRFDNSYRSHRGLSVRAGHMVHGARVEVSVTESLYNFGPHKLMRKMRFENGRLVAIETAGYGYRDPD